MTLSTIRYVVLGLSPILAALSAQPPEGMPTHDPSDSFGICGGRKSLWIYHRAWDPDQKDRLLSFGLRPAGSKVFVSPASLSRLVGKVLASAVADDELHVFYDDGSHRRYRFGQQGLRGFTELPVPGAGRLRALAGDLTNPVIYAIVPADSARALQAELLAEAEAAARAELEEASDVEGEDPGRVAVDELAALGPDLAGADWAVLRYQGGDWAVHARVDPLPANAESFTMAVEQEGRLHLLFRDPAAESYRWTYLENAQWSAPQPLPGPADIAVISFHRHNDQLVIVAGSDEGGAPAIHALVGDAGTWRTSEPFDLQGLDPTAVVAAPFGPHVALATIGKDGQIRCGLWKTTGGAPVEAPAEILALSREGRHWLPVHVQNMIAIGVLGVLLGYVFLRRQESITRELDLPAQYVVAGLGRRLIAFVLDLGPVAMLTLPAWGPPLQEWWAQREYGLLEKNAPPLSDGVMVGWLIGCAVYIGYCTVCEAVFATTPGKLAVQCRVVNEDGHRCTLRQIVLRNLLRAIELFPLYQFWPTIILLFFTRNRQRLGDLIGRTLVVQRIHPQRTRTPLSPPAPDHDS